MDKWGEMWLIKVSILSEESTMIETEGLDVDTVSHVDKRVWINIRPQNYTIIICICIYHVYVCYIYLSINV